MAKESLETHLLNCKRLRSESFPCAECLITFEFKSLRDFHMSIHKDCQLKPYRCAGCKAGFAAQTHKSSHEQKCGKLKTTGAHIPNSERSIEWLLMKTEDKSKHHSPVEETRAFFCCSFCKTNFQFFLDLEVHLSRCSQRTIANEEQLCDVRPKSPTIDIVTSLDSDTNAICPICGIDLQCSDKHRTKRKASRHMTGHDDETYKRYKCPACSWGSGANTKLVFFNHVKSCQRMPEMFPAKEFHKSKVNCPACLIEFKSVGQCSDHLLSHHILSVKEISASLVCPGCSAHYTDEKELNHHIAHCVIYKRANTVVIGDGGKACGLCMLGFAGAHKLEKHFTELHSLTSPDNLQCVICNVRHTDIKTLIHHVNTNCLLANAMLHGGQPTLPIVPEDELEDGSGSYLDSSDRESAVSDRFFVADKTCCPICGVKSKTKKHMQIHNSSELRPHHCRGCNAGFTVMGNLQSHELACIRVRNAVHSLETPAPTQSLCSVDEPQHLEADTDSPMDLEIAIDPSGGHTISCSVCDIMLANVSELQDHIIASHSAPQIKCELCEKTFKQQETLQEHNIYCGMVVQEMNSSPNEPVQKTMDDELEVGDNNYGIKIYEF